jgi:hypothetical protein
LPIYRKRQGRGCGASTRDRLDELLGWLRDRKAGLGTFAAFQERTMQLASRNEDHVAAFQLLSGLAGRFVSAYERMPLGTDVANAALTTLLRLVEAAARSAHGSADEQLRVLDDIARADLG